MKLKATYTVAELATLAEKTPKQMRRTLREAGVLPPGRKGSRQEVYLTKFREALPELWESILLAQSLAA